MRNQPSQLKQSRFACSCKAYATLPGGIGGQEAFGCAALLVLPFQQHALASIQVAPASIFTIILSVLAGILGLSASLLYRKMHREEGDLRHRAENAEAELRALLMMTDEAVLVLSPDGTIRAANPASEELFDRDAEEFLGEPLTEVLAQPLGLSDLTKHGPVNFETTAKRGADGYAQVEMLLSPVELSGGKGYLALIHERRAEFPGQPATRTTRKPDFEKAIEKFTHDLNNQLTSVLGNLSLILMSRPGDPATQERLLNAKKTAVRAQVLSQEMQALVSPAEDAQSGGPEKTDRPDLSPTILPMPKMAQASKMVPSPAAGPSRILILDDEDVICMLVASALDCSGFEVTSATSVQAALSACEEAVQAGNPFSLVICDLSLPGEMHGTEALQELRAIDPNLKAIVSSGYDSDPVMRDCRKYGFTAAMAKPYDIGKLVRTVGQVIAAGPDILRKTA